MATETVRPGDIELKRDKDGDAIPNAYAGLNEYTPTSTEELQQRAQNVVEPTFNEVNNSLTQSLKTQLSAQDREVYDYGMQRSSYAPALRQSLADGGLKAQGMVNTARQTSMATVLQNMLDTERERANNARQYRDNLLLQLYNIDHPKSSGGGGGSGSGYSGGKSGGEGVQEFKAQNLLDGLCNTYTVVPNSGHDILRNGVLVDPSQIPDAVLDYVTGITNPNSSTRILQQRAQNGSLTTPHKTAVTVKR